MSQGNKNSFVMYTDYMQHLELLDMEQRGVFLTAIMQYAAGGELPEMDGMVQMAFSFARAQIDRDAEQYRKTVEAKREAGRKGGEAKAKNAVAKSSKATTAKNAVANLHDTDTVTDTVNDTDTVTVDDTVTDTENALKEKPSYEGKKKSRSAFVPPTPDDVRTYCQQQGYDIDAQYFCDFYAKKGWMVGKNKMKDWQAAVRNWVRNNDSGGKKKSSGSAYIDAINNRMDVVDEWLRKRQEVHDDG